jgi:hypothetical protein
MATKAVVIVAETPKPSTSAEAKKRVGYPQELGKMVRQIIDNKPATPAVNLRNWSETAGEAHGS